MITTDEFVETDVTFGGYPVLILQDPSGVTIVSCKEVTGTLGQMEDWLRGHYKDGLTRYYFGYGDKRFEIVRDGDKVKIACLEEDYVGFKLKLNKFIHDVSRRERSI